MKLQPDRFPLRRPSRRRLLVVCVAGCLGLALLAGCSVLQRPPVTTDNFVFQIPAGRASGQPVKGRVLSVLPVTIAPQFTGQPFVYRTGDLQYTGDFYNRFFSPPNQLLAESLRRSLTAARLGETVVETGSPLASNTIIQAHVGELYADYRDPRAPVAVAAMRLLVLSRQGGVDTPLLDRNYRREVAMRRPVAAEAARGWSEAFTGIFAEFQRDLRRKLFPIEPKPPAVTVTPRLAPPAEEKTAPVPAPTPLPGVLPPVPAAPAPTPADEVFRSM